MQGIFSLELSDIARFLQNETNNTDFYNIVYFAKMPYRGHPGRQLKIADDINTLPFLNKKSECSVIKSHLSPQYQNYISSIPLVNHEIDIPRIDH